jgi:hypothetical protein
MSRSWTNPGPKENYKMNEKFSRVRVHVPTVILLAALLLLLINVVLVARPSHAPRQPISSTHRHAGGQSTPKQLTCLPKDVGSVDRVDSGIGSKKKVTVEEKLAEMRARCHKGKLVDRKGRAIRFFHVSCWGNPPPDYLEIQQQEKAKLVKLKQRYTVIVLGCDPFTQ